METHARIHLLRDMVRCCHNLYLWSYDPDFQLLESNCPQEVLISQFFSIDTQRSLLLDYAKQHRKPSILSNDLGLVWIVSPEWEECAPVRVHILGPLFLDDVPPENIRRYLSGFHFSSTVYQEALRFFKDLPVISMSRVFEYAIMMHYCIYTEQIQVSDLHYRKSGQAKLQDWNQMEEAKIHGTYEAEQEMLRYVREGDLNYKDHMSKMTMTGNLGKLSNNDSMRQMKNSVLVMITLFSRAAIEGGLPAETSMTLTDRYFQSTESCTTLAELAELAKTIRADFIQRVHRCRANKDLSKPVQACMDYITLHLEDKLPLSELAEMQGYTEYYLSKKFKKETGQTINEYIRIKRLERAQHLLKSTNTSVQEIGYRLQFCSQSHFSDTFRKQYGVSPSQWREEVIGK